MSGRAPTPGPSTACPRMADLPDEALDQVADYFRALSEPTRLQILELLRKHERSVGELARLCGFSAANVSRHLAVLNRHGLVARRSRGNSALYRTGDEAVYALCDLACGQAREATRARGEGVDQAVQAACRRRGRTRDTTRP